MVVFSIISILLGVKICHFNRNKLLITIFFIIASAGFADSLHADMKTDRAWYGLETQFAIISYNSTNILEIYNKSHLAEYDVTATEIMSHSFLIPPSINRIVSSVDGIYSQVQTILGLRMQLPKVNIKIFANSNYLNDAYLKLFRKERKVRAWYMFVTNTIYINAEDAHIGVLAHELAHSIIDGNLMVPPSSVTAEALAQYVENKLLDSTNYAQERFGGILDAPTKIIACTR